MPKRRRRIPAFERAGLARVEAAEYVGIGVGEFDRMVRDGRMPPPKQVDNLFVWSRQELEKYFERLPSADIQMATRGPSDPWDRIA